MPQPQPLQRPQPQPQPRQRPQPLVAVVSPIFNDVNNDDVSSVPYEFLTFKRASNLQQQGKIG